MSRPVDRLSRPTSTTASAARLFLALCASLLFSLALASCGGGGSSPTAPVAPVADDLAAATAGLGTSPALLGDDLFDVTTSTGYTARTANPFAAIEPLSFYRWVSRNTRSYAFAFSDSDGAGHPRAADVTVNSSRLGMLHLIPSPAGGAAPDTHNVIHKLMDDRWTRRVHLVRETLNTPQGARDVWRVTQASPVRIASQPGARSIASLHLTGSALDVTVTDPAQMRSLAQLPTAAADDSLTVTVVSGAVDDDVFLYWQGQRTRMHPDGGGTHSLRVWSGAASGLRSLGVNVLSRGTLHDDTSLYDSLGWIVPLWVGGTPAGVWP